MVGFLKGRLPRIGGNNLVALSLKHQSDELNAVYIIVDYKYFFTHSGHPRLIFSTRYSPI
jgi:hypothetical protein